MIYADASFVVALFANEEKRATAWRWWKSTGHGQVMISRLTLLETANTFHAHHLDHKLTAAELRQAQLGLESARMEGLLVRRETPVHRLYPEAHRRITPPAPPTALSTFSTSPPPSSSAPKPSSLSTNGRPL